MVLGGVEIEHTKGPQGHSDGDCLLHAVSDAILGAMGKGDIGKMFPDTEAEYKDISSKVLLEEVYNAMKDSEYEVSNLDCVVILESPKIEPYRDEISGTIAEVLNTSREAVSIKAKTAEGLGDIGKGEAVAAYAVVSLEKTG